MAVKKTSKKHTGAKKTDFESRVEDFGEEVENLAEKFSKTVEEKGNQWDSWFHSTFGVVAPLISSIFGILIFALALWVLDFMNAFISSSIILSIHGFLLSNVGWFFLIFLFFSYTSYFSRANQKAYLPFHPLVTAIGAVIVFWVVLNAINVSNLFIGQPALQNIAFYISDNLFWVFCIFILIGFVGLGTKLGVCRPDKNTAGSTVTTRVSRTPVSAAPGVHRLYRSANERILGGVCGGIAEFLGVDPVIIRLLWVLGSFLWGFGVLLYIICWIIIPRNPNQKWD